MSSTLSLLGELWHCSVMSSQVEPSKTFYLARGPRSGANDNTDAGDRTYLVLVKPNVIMNDIRLRELAVAGSDAAGRKSPHNHAQTGRNLRRSLRNAAAGVRLIQAEGLDAKIGYRGRGNPCR